ncbi:MAG: IS5/IS1182 family transposase, partial [Candidatus Methanofastidiosum sp.]|nr:IS5/IS1182 family transposase [Methanofastidiosum sp.]
RWLVESCFSAVKRAYGESVNAKRFDMAKKEAMLKFILYSAVQNSC